MLIAGPGAKVRTIGHGACNARCGSMPKACKVFCSHSMPYRTPWGDTQKRLSRVSEVTAPPVVVTKFAAPGIIRVCCASTDSGSRASRTRVTMCESRPGGVGSPRPLTTVMVACGSVDCFFQLTQVTGLASGSTNCSFPFG